MFGQSIELGWLNLETEQPLDIVRGWTTHTDQESFFLSREAQQCTIPFVQSLTAAQ
jgi:hypothetical protein